MEKSVYYDSPIGMLRILENGVGITKIQFAYLFKDTPSKISDQPTTPLLSKAVQQLEEYFKGKRKEFHLPLDLQGTEFQKRAWNALIDIPFGKTYTYKQIAEKIDCPKGCRAVGLANNRNPIPIIVPCHRVIGSNGKLVGYAGGLDVKEKLLEIENDK